MSRGRNRKRRLARQRNKQTQPVAQQHELTEITRQVSEYRGPIPKPEDLAQYDAILPGSAERILAMAEDQASHRRDLESRALDAKMRQTDRGQHYGLTIGLVGLVASAFMASIGAVVPAGIVGGTTIVSLVAVFVVGSVKRQ